MKKNIFLFFIISFFIRSAISQTLDSAYIKCTYKLSYIIDSTKPERVKTDVLELLIGEKTSSFYSYENFRADSFVNANIESGKISAQDYGRNSTSKKNYAKPGLYSQYHLYINYPEQKITITDVVATTKYIYEENIEKLNWIIYSDTMRILNFVCQKATTSFRGRNYEAWFAHEIPINAGPYKFAGLPGLVLKVGDDRNNYVYECIGFEQLKIKKPIVLAKTGCIKTTRKEFRKGFQAIFMNPYQALATGGNFTLKGDNADEMKQMFQRKLPFNPIELE